jgi:hypothetical protein
VNTTMKSISGFRSGAVETFGSSGEPVTSLKSEVLRSLKLPTP